MGNGYGGNQINKNYKILRGAIIMKYENEIREILSKIIQNGEAIKNIGVDDSLQAIGMNSIAFIKVVVEIENEFNIEFPDNKLSITEAGTIRDLCDIVLSFDK